MSFDVLTSKQKKDERKDLGQDSTLIRSHFVTVISRSGPAEGPDLLRDRLQKLQGLLGDQHHRRRVLFGPVQADG